MEHNIIETIIIAICTIIAIIGIILIITLLFGAMLSLTIDVWSDLLLSLGAS